MSHISHIGSSTDFRFLHLGSPSCEEAIAYINVCMKRIEEVEGNASQYISISFLMNIDILSRRKGLGIAKIVEPKSVQTKG